MAADSTVVAAGLEVLTLGMALVVLLGVARVKGGGAALKVGLGVAAWLALAWRLAAAGTLARFGVKPPPLMLLLVGGSLAGVVLGFSKLGKALAEGLPLWMLVGAQGFRLPLELVMHRAASDGLMPVEMSFSGYNFDIVTGATALALAVLLWRNPSHRAWVMGWNAMGAVLLANVVTLAVALSPIFHVHGMDPAHLNTWITHAPYVWLPAFLVPCALLGHVLVGRRLATMRSGAPVLVG